GRKVIVASIGIVNAYPFIGGFSEVHAAKLDPRQGSRRAPAGQNIATSSIAPRCPGSSWESHPTWIWCGFAVLIRAASAHAQLADGMRPLFGCDGSSWMHRLSATVCDASGAARMLLRPDHPIPTSFLVKFAAQSNSFAARSRPDSFSKPPAHE